MAAGLIVFLGMGIVCVGVIAYLVTLYNGLIDLNKSTDRSWSNIDVLLKQRHDELPKLVKTVEGYMAHERQTLEQVIEARNAVASAGGVGETARADADLQGALSRLFALAESYPELKADSSFQHLQGRISELEEQIADRREFYNHAVNRYNVRIEQIPDVFIARSLGYQDKEYFRATEEDRRDVEIEFSHVRS
ncbi:MAG: LemA family protein [Myxococcota bacterium]